jgi:hypothetical protein
MLLVAKSMQVDFEKVVTIGRQTLYLSEQQLGNNLTDFGYHNIDIGNIFKSNDGFAESFLKILGANVTDSVDASDFEKATIIQDMNLPLAEQYKFKYTCVIESGTLEHIFNFPVAVKNCMELLEENGWYIGLTPANNFLGHGFYQFSPELYFRVFSENNGFKMKTMLFYIDDGKTGFYEIKDPNEVHQRVELVNCYPSYLFVLAQKVATKNIFEKYPLQSDYAEIYWKNQRAEQFVFVPKGRKMPAVIKGLIPAFLKRKMRKLINHYNLLDNPVGRSSTDFFKKKEW